MIRNAILALACAGCIAAGAQGDEGRLDSLQSAVEGIMAKAGIQFSGEFRSRFLLSRIGGEGADPARRIDESVEYTSVDFDIGARPTSALQAKVIFRMHQDWRNFFSDVANPIFLRWVSIDGDVKRVFGYNVGDFREQYSPLTLYAPQIEPLFEPAIFSRLRESAMSEQFLANNDRLLQGVNLNFDAELFPILSELHAGVLATRLRLAETSIQNGSRVATSLEAADMDMYLLGVNIDAVISEGLSVGATVMPLFDMPSTYATPGSYDTTAANTSARQTLVGAVRGALSSRLFRDSGPFTLGLDGEFAMARDRDSAWYAYDTTFGADTAVHGRLETESVQAGALAANIRADFTANERTAAGVTVGYMRNEPDFRNPMAQSPSFVGERIMNIENDPVRAGGVIDQRYYTTFDALYGSVFKFVPSRNTNRWMQAPFRKLSYISSILTADELAAYAESHIDTAVQLMLPMGPATPNRQGVKLLATAAILKNGALALKGESYALSEMRGAFWDSLRIGPAAGAGDTATSVAVNRRLPKTAYLHVGGGFSLDIGALVDHMHYPLRISASYRHTAATNDGIDTVALSRHNATVGFLNAGAYWKFWKRLALLGGYQRIQTDATAPGQRYGVAEIQQHLSAGFEWTVAEGGALIGRIGRIAARYRHDDPSIADAGDLTARDFYQRQIELFLRVRF
jgi:hypothetical protein